MSPARSFALVFLLSVVMLNSVSFGQCVVPAPTKDAAAISALAQMVTATGWSLQNLPTDAVAVGNLTLYRTDGSTTTRAVTLQAKGNSKTRIDTADGDTPVSTLVVSDSGGAASNSFGTNPTSPYAALSTRAFFLPFLTDLTLFADSSVSVSFVGDEIVGGVSAHKVQVSRMPDPNDIICDDRARIAPLTVWISSDNGLPIQLQHPLYSNSPDPLAMITRTLSGWQTIAGISVPLQQSEYMNGQLRSVLAINNLTLNVGLSDDIFDPAALLAP